MRPWTIPILGALVLSLALPSGTDARVRFGPGAVLGAVAGSFGAMFGGYRHSSRHHRRSASRSRLAAATPALRASNGALRSACLHRRRAPLPSRWYSPDRTAALFWPDAAADLVEYLFFPNGNDRFWAYGYDTVVRLRRFCGFGRRRSAGSAQPAGNQPSQRRDDAGKGAALGCRPLQRYVSSRRGQRVCRADRTSHCPEPVATGCA